MTKQIDTTNSPSYLNLGAQQTDGSTNWELHILVTKRNQWLYKLEDQQISGSKKGLGLNKLSASLFSQSFVAVINGSVMKNRFCIFTVYDFTNKEIVVKEI